MERCKWGYLKIKLKWDLDTQLLMVGKGAGHVIVLFSIGNSL